MFGRGRVVRVNQAVGSMSLAGNDSLGTRDTVPCETFAERRRALLEPEAER